MKTLSIITINKENASELEKTIKSVICQTYTDYEYIIIDGASGDESVEVIKRYTDKIDYWISEQDTGIYNAMNKGIRKARGIYCLFLNSGDWLISPETLDNVFREINGNQSDIFYSNTIKSNNKTIYYPKCLTINHLLYRPIGHQNSLIKRSLFLEHGFYNETLKIASDWEFYLHELWKYKSIFYHLETNICVFDVHGIGSKWSAEKEKEDMIVMQNVFHELADAIIDYRRFKETTYYKIIKKHGKVKVLEFIIKIYMKFIVIMEFLLKIKHLVKRIWKKFLFLLVEAFGSLFSKKLRICFTNFKDVPHDFFMVPIEKVLGTEKYRVVKYYKPHVQLFSVFGNRKRISKSKALHKTFFTGENTNVHVYREYKGNCISDVSLSLGFDFIEADKYLRLPLWLLYYFSPSNSKDEIKKILDAFKGQYKKNKFCALVASHDRNGIRKRIYNDVTQIDSVDCPGNLLHNDDTMRNKYADNKAIYLQSYKFNICPENSNDPGYVTEKLFQSIYSGCIPIYNGWSRNPEPDIVNPNIIMWYDTSDRENNQSVLHEIKKLHSNDRLYCSFAAQPFFCDIAVDKIYAMLQEFCGKMESSLRVSLRGYI